MIRDQLADALRGALVGPGGRPAARDDQPRAAGATRARRLVVQRGPGHGQEGRPQPPRAGPAAGRPPQRRTRRRTSPRSRSPGPGFVNFRLRRHLAARRARRRRRRRASTATPGPTSVPGTHRSTSSSSAPTPPARCTPATAAAPSTATRWPGCSSACGYEVDPRVLPQRPRHPDAASSATSLAARKAGEAVPEGGYNGAVHHRLGRGDARRRRPRSSGATARGHRRPARGARRARHRTSTCGSASGRWSTAGAIDATLGDLRERGVVYDARRRGVAAQHRLRRRQGPGARQERRRVHLPAARHRLPPRQVRPRLRPAHQRVGRRPPRLHRRA